VYRWTAYRRHFASTDKDHTGADAVAGTYKTVTVSCHIYLNKITNMQSSRTDSATKKY